MRQIKSVARESVRLMLNRLRIGSANESTCSELGRPIGWNTGRVKLVLLASLIVAVLATVAVIVSSGFGVHRVGKMALTNSRGPGPAYNNSRESRDEHVNVASLSPRLRYGLQAIGDRLMAPGKERLSITGTLVRSINSRIQSSSVQITTEPGRLRMVERVGEEARVMGFDGQQVWKVGPTLDRSDEDLIQSLVYDTPDHFFLGHARDSGSRLLGMRFRLDDGADPNYSGPYYDIYQFSDQKISDAPAHDTNKHYFINSDTLMLERVRYELQRNDSKVQVEVQFNNWKQIQGQQIPGSILRAENGQKINSATASPSVADGSFTRSQ